MIDRETLNRRLTQLRAEGSEAALAEAARLESEAEDQEAQDATVEAPTADIVPPGSPAPQVLDEPPAPPTAEDTIAHVPDPTQQGQPPAESE